MAISRVFIATYLEHTAAALVSTRFSPDSHVGLAAVQVLLRGRVHSVRGKGKSFFLVLRQQTSTLQVRLQLIAIDACTHDKLLHLARLVWCLWMGPTSAVQGFQVPWLPTCNTCGIEVICAGCACLACAPCCHPCCML